MSKIFNSVASKILLVEGDNDCHVIAALCKYYVLPENFGLDSCGSDDMVFKKLIALLNTENKEAIGIVLDADNPNFAANMFNIEKILDLALCIS